jgi:hypothetical protein
MKAKYFFLLPILSLLTNIAFAQEPVTAIVRDNRVYILKDETPVRELVIRILDARGAEVYQQTFCNEDTQWYLDLPPMPAGKYSVTGNGKPMGQFNRNTSTVVIPVIGS